jgi:hypothetical protein
VLVANGNVYYGFKTKDLANVQGVSAGDLQALGHKQASELSAGALIMLRAQAPKPGRAKKTVTANPTASQQGTVSTFYGKGQESAALAAGWDLLNGGRAVGLTNNVRTVSAGAVISNGFFYIFPMNKTYFDTYKSALGLVAPTEINTDVEEGLLVRGSSRPRPGRAILELASGGTVNTFYSYDAISTAKQAGFKLISKEVLL